MNSKPQTTMTSSLTQQVGPAQIRTRIYMKITVRAHYAARTGFEPKYKHTASYGGYTPLDCVESAVQRAKDYIDRHGRKGENGQVTIWQPPTVTRITADNELPAVIILRLPYTK